jgi:hypothetical protein
MTNSISTLRSEPGGFGAELGFLGFGEVREGEGWLDGPYFVTHSADGYVRVVTYPEDGNRVLLIGFSRDYPAGSQVTAWEAKFDGSTPLSVVVAAIGAALAR